MVGRKNFYSKLPRLLSHRGDKDLPFLLSRRRPPDFFLKRTREHNDSSATPRDLCWPARRGVPQVVVVVVSRAKARPGTPLKGHPKMAFLSFAQPTRINGSEGKSIVYPSPDSQHSSTRCFCSRLLRASTGRYTVTIPATRRGRGLKFHGGCFPEQNRSTCVDNACPPLIKDSRLSSSPLILQTFSLIQPSNQGWSQPFFYPTPPPSSPLISSRNTVQLGAQIEAYLPLFEVPGEPRLCTIRYRFD